MKFYFLPLFIAYFFTPDVQASYVRGYIDTLNTDYENFKIRGWACQTNQNVSIKTDIYLNGAIGTGSMYGSLLASDPSEQGVANACSNSLKKNRFSLSVPITDVYKNRGKPIYIYGISSMGTGNKLLANSGKYKFPSVPTSKIKGYIDSLHKSGSDYYVFGWACQEYYKQSIDVHVYVGGVAGGGGKHVASGKANQPSSSAVAKACGTNASAYRFAVKIPQSTIEQYQGSFIYVHGISIINTGNSSISNSGKFSIPSGSFSGKRAVIYIHTDLLGSPVAETDINGNLQ